MFFHLVIRKGKQVGMRSWLFWVVPAVSSLNSQPHVPCPPPWERLDNRGREFPAALEVRSGQPSLFLLWAVGASPLGGLPFSTKRQKFTRSHSALTFPLLSAWNADGGTSALQDRVSSKAGGMTTWLYHLSRLHPYHSNFFLELILRNLFEFLVNPHKSYKSEYYYHPNFQMRKLRHEEVE